jgi:tol-pal system protein YbgF
MKGRMLLAALLLPAVVGCATKRDLRDLSAEIDSMRASQEAMLRQIQRQNESILDSMSTQEVRLRGDLSNQLVQIERQLIQVQELTGQGQQALVDLRETVREREQAIRSPGNGGAPMDVGDRDDLYATAADALQRGSYATAAAAFDQFVRAFSEDGRAAEAQLFVGEAFEGSGDDDRALDAYGRVLELFPNSPSAPTALYRAALIELDRGESGLARDMLGQVVAAYPQSPEATLARERLERI